MLIGNVRLIDESNGFLEVRAKRLGHNLFAQDALQQQAGQLVAVPFVERNILRGIVVYIAADGTAHLLLHIAAENEAYNDLQLLVPFWNS